MERLYATLISVAKAVWKELPAVPKRPWDHILSDSTRAILDFRRRLIATGADLQPNCARRRKDFAKQIRKACLKDYCDWVSRHADRLTAAAAFGDSKIVADVVRQLGGRKQSYSSKESPDTRTAYSRRQARMGQWRGAQRRLPRRGVARFRSREVQGHRPRIAPPRHATTIYTTGA
eukprot:COSAG01_NODE_13606_length_1559_cov_6.980137_3_plen_176_part_00